VGKSYKVGRLVTVNDPWGHGNSLEWATTTPPPLRNFDRMPRIRSERPAFDAKYPELAAGDTAPPGRRRAARGREPASPTAARRTPRIRIDDSRADRRPTLATTGRHPPHGATGRRRCLALIKG
jgi:hypothetical protein